MRIGRLILVTLALGRPRLEDCHKFNDSLSYKLDSMEGERWKEKGG